MQRAEIVPLYSSLGNRVRVSETGLPGHRDCSSLSLASLILARNGIWKREGRAGLLMLGKLWREGPMEMTLPLLVMGRGAVVGGAVEGVCD